MVHKANICLDDDLYLWIEEAGLRLNKKTVPGTIRKILLRVKSSIESDDTAGEMAALISELGGVPPVLLA